ncbi:MAG: hypothetical protein P4L76_11045 [Beijerinckiaceae bacterium]|nr:hypothetical protein [Beijerinckiaceae bacterium]
MVTTEKRARRRALKLLAASAVFLSLGALAVAAPFTFTSTSYVETAPHAAKLKPLGAGPAIQLASAGEGFSEDCVRVIRVVGPNVNSDAHGLVCGRPAVNR